MGFLGTMANNVILRKKIGDIFDYRELALKKRFPEKLS